MLKLTHNLHRSDSLLVCIQLNISVDMSGSHSAVEKETADFMGMIPSGDEHNRCRKAMANQGAAVNVSDGDGMTTLMFVVKRSIFNV